MGRISHNFSVVRKCQQGDVFINFSTLVSVLDHIRRDIFGITLMLYIDGSMEGVFVCFVFNKFSVSCKCQYRWDILITLVLSMSVSIEGIFR